MAPPSLPFGDLLRNYRVAAGLTQEELAARAGLSVDAISMLECGKRRTPRKSTVHLLAEALTLTDAEREALASWESLDVPGQGGTALTLYLLGAATFVQGHLDEAAAFQSAALKRFMAAGDMRVAGAAQFGLAAIVRQQGDMPQAAHHVRAGLEISMTLRDRFLLSWGARATLALLGEQADMAKLARLLGIGDAASQTTGGTHTVWERVAASQNVAQLREQLEREGLGAAYREGRSLPFGAAVSLALTLLEDLA
jgi:transcriptional regulator with XRE-family HTH domain